LDLSIRAECHLQPSTHIFLSYIFLLAKLKQEYVGEENMDR